MADVAPDVRLLGFSYHDLDRSPDPSLSIDLLLISIASPERLISLVTAGLRAFLPQKVVLLVEAAPDFAVMRALPRQFAGSIDQAAPADVFFDSVRRVLAGRSSFPWDPNLVSSTPDDLAQVWPPNNGNIPETPASTFVPAPAPVNDTVVSRPARSSVAPNASPVNEAELLGLTRRQYEVLVLLSRGHALKSVARILNISLGTTKAHTESVYQRLGAHNRNQAVYLARSKGATLNWETASQTDRETASQADQGRIDTPDPHANPGTPAITPR
ncbi:MAG: response regulator transcription factor [Pusillimonas sp.]|nr:response regulator transcription factor [Pusillimonas sp.]